MDKASDSQPKGCGFETNYVTNSFLLLLFYFIHKIHNNRTLFYIFFAVNASYSVLMGDFLTADFQFLSLARMGKLPPWGFLPINGRLVGAKL